VEFGIPVNLRLTHGNPCINGAITRKFPTKMVVSEDWLGLVGGHHSIWSILQHPLIPIKITGFIDIYVNSI
jgi:hypothetical protein